MYVFYVRLDDLRWAVGKNHGRVQKGTFPYRSVVTVIFFVLEALTGPPFYV